MINRRSLLPFLATLPLATSLLSWSCATTTRRVFDQEVPGLTPAQAPLVLEAGRTPLADAVVLLCDATGQDLHASPEVAEILASQHATFLEPLEVPAREAYPFVEALLVPVKLLLAPVAGNEAKLGIYSADELDDAAPLHVAYEDVGNLAEHTTLYATAEIPMGDPATVAGQLRAWHMGRPLQSVTPTEDGTLVLEGRGTWIADTVAVLSVLQAPEVPVSWGLDERRALAPARKSLVIPAGSEFAEGAIPRPTYTLADLLHDYARTTRQCLTLSNELARQIAEVEVGLRRSARVPRREVASFVEGVCNMNGLMLTTSKTGEVPVVNVTSLWGSREAPSGAPVPVAANEIEDYLQHPALWVRTVVELPHSSTRTLQTQLRAIVADTQTQNVMSIGPKHIVLSGLGHYVADLTSMLRQVDATSAGDEPENPTQIQLPPARSDLGPLPERGSLAELLALFGESTRLHVLATPNTRTMLEQCFVEHPAESFSASDAYAYVGAQLQNEGFVMAPIKAGKEPMIGVHSPRHHEVGIKALAAPLPISPESTDTYRSHPGFYARTVVDLENIDVRTLQTQLRAIVHDTTTQMMIAAGEHSLLLGGLAPEVATWVDLMGTINAHASLEPADASVASDYEPPVGDAPLSLPAGPVSLEDVLERYTEATGALFVRSRSVREQMARTKFDRRMATEVPPQESFAFLQALLTEHGLSLKPFHGTKETMLGIGSTRNRRHLMISQSLLVEPSETARFSDQTAFPIQTVVDLENTDARTLVTMLRATIADTSRMTCVSSGARTVLLQGSGSWVAGMVDMVRSIDAATDFEPASTIQLAPVERPLRFDTEGHTLATLLEGFAEASDQHLWMTAEVREEIGKKKYKVATGRELPAGVAYSMLETVLASEELAIAPVKAGDQPILGIYEFENLKRYGKPLTIDADDATTTAESHPALFIGTTVRLEKADARRVHNQLRKNITNTRHQTIVAAGQKIVVMGLAPWVAEMVEEIRKADV